VAPEDCTGCGLCVHFCPAKNRQEPRLKAINMEDQLPLRVAERGRYDFFLGIPEVDRTALKLDTVKGSQFLQPLFEYSGACSGCGETPYVKLLSQLYGDRAMIANATGCSSIYGGNLPTTPWARNAEGRGPAWANSLFEDNAEFGLGFRLTLDKHEEQARELVHRLAGRIGETLASELLGATQKSEAELKAQRGRVAELRRALAGIDTVEARLLEGVAYALCRHSVWIVGGDGWAYDIGYGGLDHVFASGRNVNVLVLDTEVYSNTGGQMSKATPLGAVAKFAAAGRPRPKKDLGMMAMSYGNVYVAQVAMGADDGQTVKAFVEAEAFEGPSLIIAYSHCIAHGINMRTGTDNQKAAVNSGHWLLYRYNPARVADGNPALQLDSRKASIRLLEYVNMEARYKMLLKSDPERANGLIAQAQSDVETRRALYEHLAALGSAAAE
jgi:pyruvate-ferredoxin/flavodoxin oxidoreductase